MHECYQKTVLSTSPQAEATAFSYAVYRWKQLHRMFDKIFLCIFYIERFFQKTSIVCYLCSQWRSAPIIFVASRKLKLFEAVLSIKYI